MVKFTRIKTNFNGKLAVTNWSATKLIEKISVDDSKLNVTQFRSFAIYTTNSIGQGERWPAQYDHLHNLPSFLPSVEMKIDKEGNKIMKVFNGIITLSVDNITDAAELEWVKQVASMMPMTLAAFVSSTGRGVKILVRIAPKDGHDITTIDEA